MDSHHVQCVINLTVTKRPLLFVITNVTATDMVISDILVMATGESVPLLSTAPEKTLLYKDFWPAVRNNETKIKHAEFEDFE